MSAQLQVTGEAKIRDLQGPVVANSGVITALDGLPSQYVRGDGTLADIPSVTGGGSSVSYYLNGSVNQGTFGGSTYYQLGESAITGVGTNFSTSTNGLLAQFITDAGVPDVTEIPSGNWNIEFYMGVSASSGALASFYVDIFKYDGTTFTLVGSNVTTPEFLTNTTTVDAYFTSVAMPLTAMAETDRIAIRVYANVASKTVTMYTEDNRLCQIVTTFSRGMLSLNSLTDQQQYITVGTAGTDFNIVSATDTHTFNIPVASATKTGKLSSTDWSTFNNKQNTIIDPITGTGTSTGVAYFNSGSSITSEAAFNYDASTNRLGVNTSVPNATIGANAGTDSGYSLLLKNDNANYNGIGFGTDSTYGNLISTEKLGTAPSRNLTLLNQSGFVSLTEAGNLGVGLLNPNTGVDIYNSSSAYLWLHTANSGITVTDGVRLALFSTNGANLRNFDGSFSITAEGDFSVITLGAENFKINSADGSIYQSKVANAMLKSVSGVITAAVANSDYQSPISLTTSGSSGAATFSSNTLNIPNYTLSGLGGVPTSRTITINGTTQNLSTDISYTVGTIGGSGSAGRVAYYDGANSITSEAGFVYDSSTNRLGVNTSFPNASIGANAGTDSGYSLLLKNADNNYNGIGFGTDSTYGNLISTEKLGTAPARNLTLLNQSGFASLKENGSFGINTLNPAVAGVGIDIYSSTSAGLRFHTATSGTTVSDGAGINFSAANNLGITNYEAGAIDIVTNGNSGVYVASNGFVGINGATPSTALTVNGSATISNLTTGQIVFPTSGGTLSGSSNLFWDNTNGRLGIGTSTLGTRKVTIVSQDDAQHLSLVSNAPSLTLANALTPTYFSTFGMATATNNFITGAVAGDLCINTNSANSIYFGNSNTSTQRIRITPTGDLGIGASSPDTKLDVRGEISLSYSASNGLRFYNQDRSNWSSIGNNIATGSSSANLVFRTSSGVALTLSPNRDATFVGALSGTSATFSGNTILGSGADDGNRLQVNGSAFVKSGNSLYLGNNTNANYWGIQSAGTGATALTFQYNSGASLLSIASTGAATFSSSVTANYGASFIIPLETPASGNVALIAKTSNGVNDIFRWYDGATQLGVFKNSGYVGIGTINPASNLNVSGTGDIFRLSGGGTSQLYQSFQNSGGNYFIGISSSTGGGLLGGQNAYSFCLVTESARDISFGTNNTERMRITSGGGVEINNSLSIGRSTEGGVRLSIQGASTDSGSYAIIIRNSTPADVFVVRNDGLYITGNRPASPYNNTTGSAANMHVASDGVLYRSTSSLKYKTDVKDYTNGLNEVMKLKPVFYKGKTDGDKQFAGLIAEEVHELGLTEFVQYASDGTPDALAYQNMVALAFKAIQEQQAQIEELKALILNK